MDLLFALAIIPPIILMVEVYRQDKVEHEPIGLVIKLIILGAISCVPTVICEELAGGVITSMFAPNSLIYVLVENFLGVALIEEFFKYQAAKIGSWKSPAFDYKFDGIVYCVASAIGFAALENVLYVFEYGLGTALIRAVTAIPGHTIFGVFMGLYYGMAKYYEKQGERGKARRCKRRAVLVPMMIHGFYDFCCSLDSVLFVAIFYVFIIALDIIAIKRIRKESRDDFML